ncbi:MAG: undecaprenyldiphospho-muramoylpentapeptide beta-N-acetylglucosaminyltransferase [Candidatus Kapabacteria bacterium]|nr:undecaprenyldiphospho-muramoylpentapeptide beta-N-acetylglucosaminyltransferase [Candidatus Kapabacteria bacterium]
MNTKKTLRIIVAAGGTGGDLFPAIAVIERLQQRCSCDVIFTGNKARMEADVVPSLGYPFVGLTITGYKGLRSVDTYMLPFRLLRAYVTMRSLISDKKPDVVLCAGTYVSYPLAMAAAHKGVPIVLIESNAIPGKANRVLADKASLIIAAFDDVKKVLSEKARRVVHVLGNPIRQNFQKTMTQSQARKHFGLDEQKTTLLVFGGSLGARSINTAVESSLQQLHEAGIQVLWQTGKNFTHSAQIPNSIHSMQFITDMAEAYSAADLVICRSGGGTVAELGVVGKPAVLVPYPYAANNEQEHNARSLVDRGAALMIRDGDTLAQLIPTALHLLHNTQQREAMAEAMKLCGKPKSADDTADAILQLVG